MRYRPRRTRRSRGTLPSVGDRTDLRRHLVQRATSEGELRQVYSALGEQIGYEIKEVEVSTPWFAGDTLATMLGLGTVLAFGRRIP